MKTFKSGLLSLVLVLSIMFSTQVSAYHVEGSNAGIKTELEKLVKNPNLIEHGLGSEDISISFRIAANQEITIIGMKSDSKYLKQFVYEKLNHQKLDSDNFDKDTTYRVKLKFELK